MCGKVLDKINARKNYKTNASRKVIDALKGKNMAYPKADKGNSIIILDNEDYKQKRNYWAIFKNSKNPLSKCITSFKNVLKM